MDTNVLVYAHNTDAPQYLSAKTLRDAAVAGQLRTCLTYQNLLEFFAVVTNPRLVVHPLSAAAARDEIRRYLTHSAFRLLHPNEETGRWLLRLLAAVHVRGTRIFDLYLAATMLTHGVTAIATFNVDDFTRIPGISVFDPGEH